MATSTPRTPSPRGRALDVDAPQAPLWGPRFDDQDTGASRRSRRHTSNPFSTANAGKATTPEKSSALKHNDNASFPSPPASPTRARAVSTPKQPRSKKTARFADLLNEPTRLESGALLLTPVKTPKAITSTPPSTGTSRTIAFQHGDPRDAMPTPRKIKGAMRKGGADIFGSKRGAANESFEIHEDWNARRPAIDLSEDNAFIGDRTASTENQKRMRTTSPKPLEVNMSDQEMEQRVNNDEGLIFSFRGKKVYRPYEDSIADNAHAEALGYHPIRRSNGKPAVLDFSRLAGASTVNANDTDEEALTDIEADKAVAEANHHQPSSQPRSSSQLPSANTTVPAATFFYWQRTKSEAAKGTRKREVDDAEEPAKGASKKAKNLL